MAKTCVTLGAALFPFVIYWMGGGDFGRSAALASASMGAVFLGFAAYMFMTDKGF